MPAKLPMQQFKTIATVGYGAQKTNTELTVPLAGQQQPCKERSVSYIILQGTDFKSH